MRKLLVLFAFTSISFLSFSQTRISGVINDETGTPLIGATVQIKGTSDGTVSDIDGKFTFETSEAEGVLIFSYVGYTTVEQSFTGSQQVEINLSPNLTDLEGVVVIGYGSVKKKDLTGAVSTVSNLEQIESRPVSNVQDFLQGSVAGVTVQQQGGDPTSPPKITIRGIGTPNPEDVLWVVDGMPYYGGTLNPSDIESISILKDGASKAIYGAQSSGGVILVTTKSGKKGGLSVSVDAMGGFSQATNLPTPLTAEEQNRVYNMAADNSGKPRSDGRNAELNPWGGVNRTNWVDEIFRNAAFYNTSVSLSGGGEKSIYSTSVNYQKKDGLLLGTFSERLGFRLKSEFNLNKHIKLGQNLYFVNQEAIGANTTSSYSGVIINAIYMPSAAPVYDEQGNFHGVAPEGSKYSGIYGDVYNPVALLLRPTISSPTTSLDANFYGELKLFNGFKYRSSFTMNSYNSEYKKFSPKIPEPGRTTEQNYLNQAWKKSNKWIWDNQISYKKTFGDHSIDLTGVYSAQFTSESLNKISAQGFAKEDSWYQYLVNAETITGSSSEPYEDAYLSMIGRAMYNYNETYYASASLRRDQSSRLHPDNNSDVFASASAGWVLSNEAFLNDISWLSFLKIRASWGQVGNIQSVSYYSYNVPLSSKKVTMGEGDAKQVIMYYVDKQSNPDLKWETSESYDLGLDLTLFNGKFEATADYYQKFTNGLIKALLPNTHIGVSKGPDENIGAVKNAGIELSITYKGNFNDFRYSVNGNMSHVNNELLNLDGYNGNYLPHNENVRSVGYPFRSAPGKELFSYFLISNDGTFKSENDLKAHVNSKGELLQPDAKVGDLKFIDSNKDGVINADDRTFKGSAFPDFSYGFNFTAGYKNFDLSLNFQGVAGAKIFNAYKFTTYNASLQGYNLDNRVLGAWSPDNPNSNIPMVRVDDPNGNFTTISDWYLEDGSYLRLKNLTIGYSLPKKFMSKLTENSSLRIYASFENLLTFTKYSGMDPEVVNHGLDMGTYPVARTITGGIALKF